MKILIKHIIEQFTSDKVKTKEEKDLLINNFLKKYISSDKIKITSRPGMNFASNNGIYFSGDRIKKDENGYIITTYGDPITYFTILHELGHYVHLNKNIDIVKRVNNTNDFEEFINIVIDEERFADRFSELSYYNLFGKTIKSPQKWNVPFFVQNYRGVMEKMFDSYKQQQGQHTWESYIKAMFG